MKLKNIMFFPNGNTAIFDNDGNQSGLQKSWFRYYINYLKDIRGEDLKDCEITMPDGQKCELVEFPDGDYNWKII